jgi:hypothetical protein
MNVQMLLYLLLEIIAVSAFLAFRRLSRDIRYTWSEADRRANQLLRSVLTSKQNGQLMWHGYLDIQSLNHPGCIYRVPLRSGLVRVIEHGKHKANLCL